MRVQDTIVNAIFFYVEGQIRSLPLAVMVTAPLYTTARFFTRNPLRARMRTLFLVFTRTLIW